MTIVFSDVEKLDLKNVEFINFLCDNEHFNAFSRGEVYKIKISKVLKILE